MGYAAARALAADGARIALIGRGAAGAADRAAALAAETGAQIFGFGLETGGISAAIEAAIETLGGVDGLAVTAGPIRKPGNLLELDDADWQESFDTQLMLTVRSVRAVLPPMIAAGGGAIVTTAAMSIRQQKDFLPHYTAMKAAVASVTKNVAKVYGPAGVRANCIAPGAVASEALDETRREAATLYPDETPDEALNRYAREHWKMNIALGRVGAPDEVGSMIAFLLSAKASYITGALVNIDGGTDF